jgi:hypothetical protein
MASHEIIREPRIVLTLSVTETDIIIAALHNCEIRNYQQGELITDLLNDLHDAINEGNTGARD